MAIEETKETQFHGKLYRSLTLIC